VEKLERGHDRTASVIEILVMISTGSPATSKTSRPAACQEEANRIHHRR
jgi:hypothetical protein